VTTVALVGAGRMGSAMARSLARAGLSLVLQNRTRDRAEALAADVGGRVAATPAEAASLADVSLTTLADDAAVRAVYGGENGLLAGARPGAVLVDLSTVTPTTIRSFATTAAERRVGLLDSPVSGSVALAESGGLTLMVGGPAADLEKARPALEPLAKSIVHIGPLGTGAAMKLAVNTVIFGLNGALAEGLVLAEAAGIERSLAWDVFAASAIGAPYVGYKRAAFVEPDSTPVAFALELADKDLGLIATFADGLGVPMPQARLNLDVIRAAEADISPDADFATVAIHLRNRRSTGGDGREARGRAATDEP
jgi:3-hydroxyisobutyrate dehydrogenase-like beta-hydroxyacid dehydrogenase